MACEPPVAASIEVYAAAAGTAVRIAMLVSSSPVTLQYPTEPQQTLCADASSSAMISIARSFGAPVIDPPGKAARSISSATAPGVSWPTTVDTRWWVVAALFRSERDFDANEPGTGGHVGEAEPRRIGNPPG